MGMGQEYRNEMAINNFLQEQATMQLTRDKSWKTRDGRLLKISDMDTEHLVSTVKFLIRNQNYPNCIVFIKMMKEELQNRLQTSL